MRAAAEVAGQGRTAAGTRDGMVGARGFEPPTSSSRTMRATKLRHAPTEVPVLQGAGIVARDGVSRHGTLAGGGPGGGRGGGSGRASVVLRQPAGSAGRRRAVAAPRRSCRGPPPRPEPAVQSRTTWAVSVARKYQGTGTLRYERPISRPVRCP